MLKNLFKNNKNNEVRKLNENDMKGLTYCIDKQIRVRLSRINNKQILIELYNGRVHEFNKIKPYELNPKNSNSNYKYGVNRLVANCADSFYEGNYVTRNKRIEIER